MILENKVARKYLDAIEQMMQGMDGGNDICLCHFPIAEWNGYFRNAWHIYGHIHNKKAETYEL